MASRKAACVADVAARDLEFGYLVTSVSPYRKRNTCILMLVRVNEPSWIKAQSAVSVSIQSSFLTKLVLVSGQNIHGRG